jgi:hypothetical protein
MEKYYKYKYFIYKKKYLELQSKINSEIHKELKGGNPFRLNPEDVIYIRNTFVENIEYCGIFLNDNGTLFIVKEETRKGDPANDRLMCLYNKYDNIIWHTHPNTSKYYPSLEDILKVLKRDIIHYSYLFTKFGYWILFFSGIFEHVKDPRFHDYIEDTNNRFYRETGRGVEYNREAIEKYTQNLMKNIRGFIIEFYNYS